jgi:hypothetical protein
MHVPANSGAAWQDLVRENARTLRKLTEAHPTLVLHLVSNPRAGAAAALEANEALFGAVVRAGFTPRPGGPEGRRPRGGPRQRVRPGGPGEREWFRALLEAQPADKFPAQARVYDGVTEAASRSDFEYGLGVILAGLEASRIRGGEEEAR